MNEGKRRRGLLGQKKKKTIDGAYWRMQRENERGEEKVEDQICHDTILIAKIPFFVQRIWTGVKVCNAREGSKCTMQLLCSELF